MRAIKNDKTLTRQISEENKKVLESKLKGTEGGLSFRIYCTYRHLARASEGGNRWMDLGLPTVGEKASLAKRVHDYLKDQDQLLLGIDPSPLLRKSLKEGEKEKSLGDIFEAFLRLRAKVPCDKLSDFVRGMVMPLHRDGADLDVEASLVAKSESAAIKQSAPDQKVKETLQQIQADVLDESQE